MLVRYRESGNNFGINTPTTYELTMTKRNYLLSLWCDELKKNKLCDKSMVPWSPIYPGTILALSVSLFSGYIYKKTGMWMLGFGLVFSIMPISGHLYLMKYEKQWNIFMNRNFKLLPEEIQEATLNFDDKLLDKHLPADFNYKKALKKIKTRFEIENEEHNMDEDHH